MVYKKLSDTYSVSNTYSVRNTTCNTVQTTTTTGCSKDNPPGNALACQNTNNCKKENGIWKCSGFGNCKGELPELSKCICHGKGVCNGTGCVCNDGLNPDNKCDQCNDGLEWNSDKTKCVKPDTKYYGLIYGYKDNQKCYTETEAWNIHHNRSKYQNQTFGLDDKGNISPDSKKYWSGPFDNLDLCKKDREKNGLGTWNTTNCQAPSQLKSQGLYCNNTVNSMCYVDHGTQDGNCGHYGMYPTGQWTHGGYETVACVNYPSQKCIRTCGYDCLS